MWGWSKSCHRDVDGLGVESQESKIGCALRWEGWSTCSSLSITATLGSCGHLFAHVFGTSGTLSSEGVTWPCNGGCLLASCIMKDAYVLSLHFFFFFKFINPFI